MSKSIPSILIQEINLKLSKDSFFVTGGTGFFGRSFLDFLIDNDILDCDITILARNPDNFFTNYSYYRQLKNLKIIKGDIQSFEFPISKFDYILHLATPASASLNLVNPLLMSDIILNGTRHLLNFAIECSAKSVLFTSSGAVYGRQPSNISAISESYSSAPFTQDLGSAYGESKRMSELIGCEYSRKYKFDFKIARCFAFVGPHLDQSGSFAIGNFICDAVNNRTISLSGDGAARRSYLYSEDLVVWLLKILFDGKSCEPYNVGSDQSLSILELAQKIKSILNPQIEISVANINDQNKPKEQYIPSITKAKHELGLEVWTDLETAILKSAKK